GKTLCFGIPMIHTILEWRKASDGKQSTDGPDDSEPRVESLYLPAEDSGDASAELEEDLQEEDVDDPSADEANDCETDDVTERQTQTNTHKQPLLGLILTPTRELAVQVKHHIDAVARFTGQCVLINTYC
ncbi:hypothetical protein M9458_035463, partial [Cirrhinus mrigala]